MRYSHPGRAVRVSSTGGRVQRGAMVPEPQDLGLCQRGTSSAIKPIYLIRIDIVNPLSEQNPLPVY